jgi:hypothetical protein
MTPFEKAQVKKVMAEVSIILALAALILVMTAIAGGDDDEEKKEMSYAYNFILYQAIRMRSETTTYLPVIGLPDIYRTIKSPSAVMGVADRAAKFINQFLLTWDEEILTKCGNSVLYPFGTSWILDFIFNEKEYKITTLIGGKSSLSGHKFRHKLPEVLKDSNIPVDIFNSINLPYSGLDGVKKIKDSSKKNELFYSQYHITIENVRHNNYFSEKLIDCFQTKTIPIYYGAPNIGDFFDIRGMFIIENHEDIISTINSITPETYKLKQDFIEFNYEKSMEYSNFKERLKTTILNSLKK